MAFKMSRAREVSQREDQGTEVPIKNELGEVETYIDANDETQTAVIIMAGKNSPRYRRKESEQNSRRIKANSLTEGKFKDDAQELTVACVIGWRGVEEDDGSAVKCNEHNVLQVFKAAPWVYDDCVEAMNSPVRFTTSSSPA
jgi:hypothetical protein